VNGEKIEQSICFNCNQPGHIGKNCPKKLRNQKIEPQNSDQGSERKCHHCGKLGHTMDFCFYLVPCKNCGKVGHSIKRCTQIQQNNQESHTQRLQRENEALQAQVM